jgi:polyphenol oxidase
MQNWHWHPDHSHLTCSLLKDWTHGFFSRQVWPSPPETILSMLQPQAGTPKTGTPKAGTPRAETPRAETQVYRLKQVHGNRVLNASELRAVTDLDLSEGSPDVLVEADGLFTTAAHQAVWACTADCTPVLIGDVATGQVAAVHAGWRGTAMQIVPEAVAQLQAQGSQIADLRVAMGPAIAGEVYQVSTTVAAQVGATVLPGSGLASEAIELEAKEAEALCAQLQQMPNSPVLPDPQPGRARLDVRRVNALQLAQLGLEPDQIAIAPYCTFQTPEHFFSYRPERQKKVQWSGIVNGVQ